MKTLENVSLLPPLNVLINTPKCNIFKFLSKVLNISNKIYNWYDITGVESAIEAQPTFCTAYMLVRIY